MHAHKHKEAETIKLTEETLSSTFSSIAEKERNQFSFLFMFMHRILFSVDVYIWKTALQKERSYRDKRRVFRNVPFL